MYVQKISVHMWSCFVGQHVAPLSELEDTSLPWRHLVWMTYLPEKKPASLCQAISSKVNDTVHVGWCSNSLGGCDAQLAHVD
jgi:hypothetical protein